MVANDHEAAAGRKTIHCPLQSRAKLAQLIVYRYPQRLKAPRRRVIGAIFGLLLCFAVIAALIGLSK